jgi:hypothetical protein
MMIASASEASSKAAEAVRNRIVAIIVGRGLLKLGLGDVWHSLNRVAVVLEFVMRMAKGDRSQTLENRADVVLCGGHNGMGSAVDGLERLGRRLRRALQI